MPFQSTVRFDQAGGVPGDFMNDGPTRAEPGVALTAVTVGCAVSESPTQPGRWQLGLIAGALRFGVVTNAKQYAARGTQAGGTLAPTLSLPEASEIEVCTMGHIWAASTTASSVPGWVVQFDNTTGVISAKAAGPADAGNTLLPNTKVAPLPGASTTPNLIGIVLTN